MRPALAMEQGVGRATLHYRSHVRSRGRRACNGFNSDMAAWSRVRFDTKRAMQQREALIARGLHCIGLWHTHPEPMPQPSLEDRTVAREHALAAKPQLTGLVFVIVGTVPPPEGLRVWVDDGSELHEAAAL
jgi:proteasome lid subunit RPN8/RPN11